ncbi:MULTISPECIES: putative quinol monooxygenase [Leptospira]|uniref:Antibiotic biosynthesis monooxygenase n=2 Tax=Leptospira TaxID=171 RepID=A0A2M9XVA1_9LEPT|nr:MULTISPECIES: putative quinol monooxygenase [Leptospira]AYV57117.1 antibiotic biosynthesis monooxygenase [Leptospira kmetyi]EQA53340.1 antibiotic biosynthesis monooxygenase [Leptospira kmetyi serovar Malaysia str. Bejo-Iso9]PJZ31838.1 antibiotic biosynthesis monooxygenase [Leptospira kmetyi]PJZ43217.1 antibiotic biosynthesis monooxygenase [Leptospira kmetyi]PJZ58045.1 antibiotic biosynthesis monooxygenase [Leptospira barantonii]
MIVIMSSYKVLEERIEDFKKISHEMAKESLDTEDGVLRLDVLQGDGDPGRFVFMEVYKSEAARKKHLETPQFISWRRAVPEWFSQGSTSIQYLPVHIDLLG